MVTVIVLLACTMIAFSYAEAQT